ncbi:unnamed protein product [Penicillium nalgiovense]|nr:unnamed protein product [Penicillium nalgiovense]
MLFSAFVGLFLLFRCPREYGRKYGALSVMLVGYVWAVSFFSVFFMSDAQVSFFYIFHLLGVVRETCTLWFLFNFGMPVFTIYLHMEIGRRTEAQNGCFLDLEINCSLLSFFLLFQVRFDYLGIAWLM